MKTKNLIMKTIITMVIILLFYFIAGAAVVTRNLEGTQAKLTQGIFIWLSVVAVIAFTLLRDRKLTTLGFRRIRSNSLRKMGYFAPIILISLLGVVGGIGVVGEGHKYIFASLFLTIGVGFSEEIYFRGIICNLWEEKGKVTAIAVSSILFGICHLMNVLGGAGIYETILQIFFAFFYGIVFALIFIVTDSLWPCVILHFLHDFFSFIGAELSMIDNIIIGCIQTGLLLAYIIFVVIRVKKQGM